MTTGQGMTPFASALDKKTMEHGTVLAPKFDEHGLIPAVVTHFDSGELLMVGFMNETALQRTIETGHAWYWSRSRQEYWKKGATSGQVQEVVEIRTDCDQDAIWLRVRVAGNGATCHVGYRSCFYRRVETDQNGQPHLVFAETERVYDPAEVYSSK
ncbi:phosphoribosyl-AMP cyclohydrolase [Pseudovibrio exalbescens]|uniref:Phosphoribosyl-AMP cyclohydrolase n=1 Tax=Pseudovibrio exalbescens TaxID=197461 RepID=A0A1U7JKJ4_9HYPH|nr:phosphoribosyl-AMP cyclohydrolase [Pseudovibrio exalbescens]OKL45214.1 phosphoribosyl-AMP cyclohydrolase [Pseudovibrio exalbescens]